MIRCASHLQVAILNVGWKQEYKRSAGKSLHAPIFQSNPRCGSTQKIVLSNHVFWVDLTQKTLLQTGAEWNRTRKFLTVHASVASPQFIAEILSATDESALWRIGHGAFRDQKFSRSENLNCPDRFIITSLTNPPLQNTYCTQFSYAFTYLCIKMLI